MPGIEVADTILSVDREEWDRLAGGDVYATWGWLRTVEQSSLTDPEPRYFLASEDGRLVAATVRYRAARAPGDLTLDGIVYGRYAGPARVLGLSLLPASLCGRISSYGTHILTESALASEGRSELCRSLVEALEAEASAEGLALCFTSVLEDEVELTALLRRRGYAETVLSPVCYLDLPWPSFDGYLRYLRGKSRYMAKNAKREIRRLRDSGLRIQAIEDTSPHEERLFELADRHWYGHNREPFPYRRDFFRRLQQNLGRHAVFHGAFAGTSLVGFSLVLEKGGVAYGLHHGVDSAVNRQAAAYFNLCFYAPIRTAIAAANQRIYFGRGLPDPKLRRGCSLRPVLLFHRSSRGLKRAALGPLFRLHAARSRRKARRAIAALGNG